MSLRSLTQLSLPFFLHSLRTLRSLLRPMTQVGVKASDKKWDRGNQNQNWVKTRTPTTEGMWVCPVLDCSEIVTLWPPARNHKWINEFLGNSRRIPEWCIFKTDAVKGATSASQTTMLSAFSSVLTFHSETREQCDHLCLALYICQMLPVCNQWLQPFPAHFARRQLKQKYRSEVGRDGIKKADLSYT